MNRRVAVLMGGQSAEREISLASGQSVLQALLRQGVEAEAIDAVGSSLVQRLQEGSWQAVFIALHGRGGEDGSVQGLLECLRLPYTGSAVLASALAMDKLCSKAVWQGRGLPTPACVPLLTAEDCQRALDELGLPLIIKPSSEGSSIGMSRVDEASAMTAAWEKARRCHSEVFAERLIVGQELTVAILAGRALPVIAIDTPRQFYDFAAKYQAADTRFQCPASLSAEQTRACQELALAAFAALGCAGWGRVDLFLDRDGGLWLIEVNTVPGMTDHSLLPMAARAAGMDFDTLVMAILDAASTRSGGEA